MKTGSRARDSFILSKIGYFTHSQSALAGASVVALVRKCCAAGQVPATGLLQGEWAPLEAEALASRPRSHSLSWPANLLWQRDAQARAEQNQEPVGVGGMGASSRLCVWGTHMGAPALLPPGAHVRAAVGVAFCRGCCSAGSPGCSSSRYRVTMETGTRTGVVQGTGWGRALGDTTRKAQGRGQHPFSLAPSVCPGPDSLGPGTSV